MTPYYTDDHVTIYHADTLDLLPTLPDNTAQAVITDPPYFRTVNDEWDDQWGADPQAFLRWIGDLVDQSTRLLEDRGTLAMFCSPDMSGGVEMEIRRRMNYLNHVVWRKPIGRLGKMDKAILRRFFPTSERIIIAEQARNPDGDLFRFANYVNHRVAEVTYAEIRERLVALRDRAGVTNRQVDAALGTSGMAGHYFGASQWHLPTEAAWSTIVGLLEAGGVDDAPTFAELRAEFDSRRAEFDSRRREFDSRRSEFDSRRREFDPSADIELLSDVWTFGAVLGNERTDHPTQKPIALMRHLVATLTRPGDLVLDPFAGTGSTLRAAKDLGRRAIGIELDERWCETAARRCSQEALPLYADTSTDPRPSPANLFDVTQ